MLGRKIVSSPSSGRKEQSQNTYSMPLTSATAPSTAAASRSKIASSIAEGRAYGMPAWGAMLTPAQTWQITAYIKSMRTEREPDAPAGR